MNETIPVDEIFALVTTAFSEVVSVHGQSPHELFLFGQRVSDALEFNLASDDIPLRIPSHTSSQERRRLALHAAVESVSASRLRRAALARTRKYVAWQPGELCFCKRERGASVTLPGRRGAWCGTATILVQGRRPVGNVESMSGVVWLVHGKVLLRATLERLRPAIPAERVLGESQNTTLDEFTQVVDNLPNIVADGSLGSNWRTWMTTQSWRNHQTRRIPVLNQKILPNTKVIRK